MMDAALRHTAIKSWFWAIRPFSMSASISPVLVGTAIAAATTRIDWLLFALALTGSMAIQVGTNLTDEYADHRKHGSSSKFLAPHKVIQRGLLSERAVFAGMIAFFGYGIAAGLVIVSQVGWPILAVGLASVAVAYFYSGGPYPLGNLGLGELFVFVFMGPLMVLASYYVQTQDLTVAAFWVSLPVAFVVTAILHCNNIRDVDEDRGSGKRSIAGWIGLTPSRWLYAGLLGAAYGSVLLAVWFSAVGPWALLGLAPAPWAFDAAVKLFKARERRDMNMLMVRSAKLHGWTGISLATGLAVQAVL
jgi:1,4-dihydroxy-2-naphthoate polyprenyltransferase